MLLCGLLEDRIGDSTNGFFVNSINYLNQRMSLGFRVSIHFLSHGSNIEFTQRERESQRKDVEEEGKREKNKYK